MQPPIPRTSTSQGGLNKFLFVGGGLLGGCGGGGNTPYFAEVDENCGFISIVGCASNYYGRIYGGVLVRRDK